MRCRSKSRRRIVYHPRPIAHRVSETSLATGGFRNTVVALVEPAIRQPIIDATRAVCGVVHVDSVAMACEAAANPRVTALLVSPAAIANDPTRALSNLLFHSAILSVAVVGEHVADANRGLLDLGSHGVRNVVDLSQRGGWNELREFIAKAGDMAMNQILQSVMPAIFDSSLGTRRFMELLIRAAPQTTSARSLGAIMCVHPPTLMSRFFRAGLPAPKQYLAGARLMYAASYLENRLMSVAKVADRLDYSSPQSFGRHVKTVMGMTATDFRYRYTLQASIDRFIKTLVAPHLETLRSFDPLGLRLRASCKMGNVE